MAMNLNKEIISSHIVPGTLKTVKAKNFKNQKKKNNNKITTKPKSCNKAGLLLVKDRL